MKLSNRLRELRKEKKLTQKELAEALDIPYRTLLNWELDKRMPTYENMIKLQDFFNVSGAYLRGETDQRTPMNRYEDSEIMNTIDENISMMLSNISKLINKENESMRDLYYVLLVEIQRLFNYDYEIQSYMLDTIIKSAYATSRLTDIALSIKKDSNEENDLRYYKVLEKETNKIHDSLESIISYIDYD